MWFVEWIKSIDWVIVGVNIFTWLSALVGLLTWLKKQFIFTGVDELQLLMRAVVKGSKNRDTEVSELKREVFEVKKLLKETLDELRLQKKDRQ